jgi:hypothetical protein
MRVISPVPVFLSEQGAWTTGVARRGATAQVRPPAGLCRGANNDAWRMCRKWPVAGGGDWVGSHGSLRCLFVKNWSGRCCFAFRMYARSVRIGVASISTAATAVFVAVPSQAVRRGHDGRNGCSASSGGARRIIFGNGCQVERPGKRHVAVRRKRRLHFNQENLLDGLIYCKQLNNSFQTTKLKKI